MRRLAVASQGQGSQALVVEALGQVEMGRVTMPAAALGGLWVEDGPSIEVLRRRSLLLFSRKRKACSCFNITITKSKVQDEQAL